MLRLYVLSGFIALTLAGPGAGDAAAQQTYPLVCSLGPSTLVQLKPQNALTVTFIGALDGADAVPPEPGECAWRDRPLGRGEPARLAFAGNKARALVEAMFRRSRGEQVVFDAYNQGNRSMSVTCIHIEGQTICD